jgi:acetyltransferase-like isoleucine patch superfamily enzyme
MFLKSGIISLIFHLKYLMVKRKYSESFFLGEESRIYPSSHIAINSETCDGFIKVGNRTLIRGDLLTFGHGGRITIGDDCFVGRGSHIWSAIDISIADRVLISHNVNIFDNLTHPISAIDRHLQFRHIVTKGHPKSKINLGERRICIENDALICCSSIVLRGVTIGEGAIIGAGSVVTKDIPPWTIVAGNPAHVIREIPENERQTVHHVGRGRQLATDSAGSAGTGEGLLL